MDTTKSKTVFIEYSSARQGQHFMTVVQTIDHERIIIGRIYREYNPETKKTYYKAYDFNADQIFGNGYDISELKNKFKKSGKFMADFVLATRRVARQKNVRIPINHKTARINDIKAIRDKKTDKEKGKTKNPEKKEINEKTKLNQMEKEQDAKNAVQYKDLAHLIEGEKAYERSQEKVEANSNIENPNQENQSPEDQSLESEKSERDMELEQIRADNDDREQDIDGPDQDIDL
jgi:hypothetical protein